jgi:hypothetical protein
MEIPPTNTATLARSAVEGLREIVTVGLTIELSGLPGRLAATDRD